MDSFSPRKREKKGKEKERETKEKEKKGSTKEKKGKRFLVCSFCFFCFVLSPFFTFIFIFL